MRYKLLTAETAHLSWGFTIAFTLLFAAELAAAEWQFTRVEMTPNSALQLGEAALVSPELLRDLSIDPGRAAMLSCGEREVEVLLYPINRSAETISINKALRDSLGVNPGEANVTLRLLAPSESRLEAIDKPIRIESQEGDPQRWHGFVLGAPHGDCDMFTGEVVALTTQECGVPSVCAYGSRISYLGRWIDVNRPLQRRPRPASYGVLPFRDWTDEAAAIFTSYKNTALRVSKQPNHPAGEPPLDLYFDFHGHDLTVSDAAGKSHYRNVFECMARDFNMQEVRTLKRTFNACVGAEFGDEAPASHWGNLPEDQDYEFNGMQASFFYSGLGGRVYGVMASDVAKRAIHIESPNMVRLAPANRPRMARALSEFLSQLRDELVPASLSRQTAVPAKRREGPATPWAAVPNGAFLMGAPDGEGWSAEWPQHWVELSEYEIGVTEVTCREYASFLNDELSAGRAVFGDDEVCHQLTGKTWCVLWPKGPLALLERKDDRVSWRDSREQHPVNYVTWHGARAMAASRNAALPTEAQWEKAAGWDASSKRGRRTSISLDRFKGAIAATLMNSGDPSENVIPPSTTPVAYHGDSRSPVGCFDMSGNVWEWTLDWEAAYEETSYPLQNPTGPLEGTMKIVRGGAWDTERETATPSFRLGVSPDAALPNIGFRLVREPRSE